MEKIRSITEAYSMQPSTFTVLSQEYYEGYYDKQNACKEIKIEQVSIGPSAIGDAFMAYVGYNFEGKKIFQYRCDSVNVHYGEPL